MVFSVRRVLHATPMTLVCYVRAQPRDTPLAGNGSARSRSSVSLVFNHKSKLFLSLVGLHWKRHIVDELDSALDEWIDTVPNHRA